MSSGEAPALRCVGVRKSFGRTPVLEGVDLAVAAGDILAVLGPSGGGKTTLLRVVAGFERADAGIVDVRGRVVEGPGVSVLPERRGVGIVPQEGALFPHLSVAANVAYGLRRGTDRAGRVAECLELVGLRGYEKARPHELSGGQQQRVALARAIAPRPALVMLDEPFASLDAALRVQVRAEVCAVLREAGTTAVLVTHDQQEALSVADEVAVLLHGRIQQSSDPVTLYRAPANLDVATFVGEAVVVPGVRAGDVVESALGALVVGDGNLPRDVVVAIRPEQIALGDGPGSVPARVVGTAYFGHDAVVHVAVGGVAGVVAARVQMDRLPATGDDVRVRVTGAVLAYPAYPARPVAREEAVDPDGGVGGVDGRSGRGSDRQAVRPGPPT